MKRIISAMLLAAVLLVGCGGSATISLKPEDADLSNSSAMVENDPKNIGGWETGGYVIFPIEIKKEGWYDIELDYSKEGSVLGTELVLEAGNELDGFLSTWLASTGPNGDWSKYEKKIVGSIFIDTQTKALRLSALNPLYGDHVINLRGVTLKQVDEDKKAEPIAIP